MSAETNTGKQVASNALPQWNPILYFNEHPISSVLAVGKRHSGKTVLSDDLGTHVGQVRRSVCFSGSDTTIVSGYDQLFMGVDKETLLNELDLQRAHLRMLREQKVTPGTCDRLLLRFDDVLDVEAQKLLKHVLPLIDDLHTVVIVAVQYNTDLCTGWCRLFDVVFLATDTYVPTRTRAFKMWMNCAFTNESFPGAIPTCVKEGQVEEMHELFTETTHDYNWLVLERTLMTQEWFEVKCEDVQDEDEELQELQDDTKLLSRVCQYKPTAFVTAPVDASSSSTIA